MMDGCILWHWRETPDQGRLKEQSNCRAYGRQQDVRVVSVYARKDEEGVTHSFVQVQNNNIDLNKWIQTNGLKVIWGWRLTSPCQTIRPLRSFYCCCGERGNIRSALLQFRFAAQVLLGIITACVLFYPPPCHVNSQSYCTTGALNRKDVLKVIKWYDSVTSHHVES